MRQLDEIGQLSSAQLRCDRDCRASCCMVLQVLYLDADNFVLRDPTTLFNSHQYNETAAILWPDFWENTVAPQVAAFACCSLRLCCVSICCLQFEQLWYMYFICFLLSSKVLQHCLHRASPKNWQQAVSVSVKGSCACGCLLLPCKHWVV